jgi:hypothetical protein
MTKGLTSFTSGVNTSFSSQLNTAFEYMPIVESQDQTGGSAGGTGAVAETKIAEATVAANKVKQGVLIIASGTMYLNYGSEQASGVITVRCGTSSTITSNASVRTLTRGGRNSDWDTSWAIAVYYDAATWSSLNYVQVGGSSTQGSGASCTITCDGLIVLEL